MLGVLKYELSFGKVTRLGIPSGASAQRCKPHGSTFVVTFDNKHLVAALITQICDMYMKKKYIYYIYIFHSNINVYLMSSYVL